MSQVLTTMTQQVATASETDSLSDVWSRMSSLGVRHIPVTRGGKVVGMLSDRDILRRARCALDGELVVPRSRVADVMTKPVVTCTIEDRIGYVATVMLEKRIGAVPVTTPSGVLVGILTSTDLLQLLRDREDEIHTLPWDWETARVIASQRCWRPSGS